MRKKDKHILNKLIDVAKKVSMKSKHAAAIVNKNKIISIGYNYSIPKKNGYHTIHAERDVLTKCKKTKIKGSSLYIIRLNKSNKKFLLSKPCPMCLSLIKTFNRKYKLKTTYYTI